MAKVGLVGTETWLSSVDNQVKRMQPGEKEIEPSFGLLTLCDPIDAKLEYVYPGFILVRAKLNCISIVFVHGLQGHATRTWATSNLCWPKDLLPQNVPCARVLTFGYNALVTNEPPPQIRDLAKCLLDSLSIDRRLNKAGSRPLIFVAHSLGGLIVKRVRNS